MATAEKTNDPRKVTLKNVRLSFPELREKGKSHKDGKPKFSASFILDPRYPEHAANMKALKAAVKAAEVRTFGEGKEGIIERTVQDLKRIVFKPGDKFTNEDGDVYDGYDGEGIWGIGSCKSDKRPKLFDRKKKPCESNATEEQKEDGFVFPLEDIDDVFLAGQTCDAIVSLYCTKDPDQGGRGLFASVDLIRARQVGDTFGAGNNASADDLDDLDDDDDDGMVATKKGGAASLLDDDD